MRLKFLSENPKADILSGLTVALALVPEAVAFSFVAGVAPMVGLYSAFIICFLTSLFGGRPGMISAATGAIAVVIVALVQTHGPEYLFAAVVVMGLLQLLAGALNLGRFIRLVPTPVMLGFVNGLAIVIFLAQLEQFQISEIDKGQAVWLSGPPLYLMLGLVALTMALMHFLPKLTKKIPAALGAILLVSLGVTALGLHTRTVGDITSIAGGLPVFHIPQVPVNLETLQIVLPYALVMAGVGLIETLLTLTVVDEMTETSGNNAKECLAQGFANLVTGFFGGMGGCAMIGQSMININSGGRGRLSGLFAAVALLFFILAGSSLIEQIPIAALVGVMFMVVIATFEWASFRLIPKMPKSDAVVLIAVTVITVFTNLATAVVLGVVIAALTFAWKSSKHLTCDVSESHASNTRVYMLHGQLFFGSVGEFKKMFNPASDPDTVIIDFKHSRVWDHSALEAIEWLAERYELFGKQLTIRHLSLECQQLLTKAGCRIQQAPNLVLNSEQLTA
jgi:SulP family sulfate permease